MRRCRVPPATRAGTRAAPDVGRRGFSREDRPEATGAERRREVAQHADDVPPPARAGAGADKIEGRELRRRDAVPARRRVDQLEGRPRDVAVDDELDPTSADHDLPALVRHDDLHDLGCLRGRAVVGGRGQEADVVREPEVRHHRVEEQAPGRRADSAVLERNDDVEAAHRRDDEARGLGPGEGGCRARCGQGGLLSARLRGRERVLPTSGQSEQPGSQVAHMLDHTLFVRLCI